MNGAKCNLNTCSGLSVRTQGTPPRLRLLRWLREILLMTQPPLLAVMRGGDSRTIAIHSHLIDCSQQAVDFFTAVPQKTLWHSASAGAYGSDPLPITLRAP